MINYYQRSIKDRVIRKLAKYQIGGLILVSEPSEIELDDLAKRFKLERDLLSDALDPYEVPRLEIENDIAYVFARIPIDDGRRSVTRPLLIIVGKSFLMLVAKGDLDNLFKDLRRRSDFFTTQRTKCFLQIVREIQADYSQMLTKINRKINYFALNMEEIGDKDIAKFVQSEIALNEFLNALLPVRYVLANIAHGRVLTFYHDDEEMLEDLRLDDDQLIERCRSNLSNSVNLRQAYEVISTNRLNRTMKLLTAMTVVLALPTMVTSFYGMNVGLPFASSHYVFWGILVFIAGLIGLLLFIFRNRRLL